MSCGCYEDQIRTGMKQIEQKFENAGKYCISKVYEGYHEWHVWRKSLYDFVPLLFRKAGAETDDIPGERTARITRQRLQRQTMEEQILMFDPVYRQIRFETDEAGEACRKIRTSLTESALRNRERQSYLRGTGGSLGRSRPGRKRIHKTQERSGKTRILDRGNPQYHAGIP